jgi:hypothetical protein
MAADPPEDAILDPFVGFDLYPDPSVAFSWTPKPLSEIKDEAFIVLDTNALLLPFETSARSLEAIGQRYSDLARAGRLVVPGQVAREFAKNRTNKIANLYQLIDKHRSSVPRKGIPGSPILEKSKAFQQAKELEDELLKKLDKYHKALGAVADEIANWGWNDPVTELYRAVLAGAEIIDPKIDREKLAQNHKRRQAHKLPPGYKDAGKPDGGIGDSIIWETILQLGSDKKSDLIFVTGEEKPDWWHRGAGSRLLAPRYELVEEYRRASDGATFQIMRLSDFLELSEVEGAVVSEVRKQEEDDREYWDLLHELMDAHWYVGDTVRNADGTVSIRFRDHTADYEGMKSRWAHGKTGLEAVRNAKRDLDLDRQHPPFVIAGP